MKNVLLIIVLFVSVKIGASNVYRDTFPCYDSLAWSRAFQGLSDIRWNSYQYRDPYGLGGNKPLKGIESSSFYKALRAQITASLPPSSGLTTAQNGLTNTGSIIEFGGANPLIHNTTLKGNDQILVYDSLHWFYLNTQTPSGSAFGRLFIGNAISLPTYIQHQNNNGLRASVIADCDNDSGIFCEDPVNANASGFSGLRFGDVLGYQAEMSTNSLTDTSYLRINKDGFFARGIDTINKLSDNYIVWDPSTNEIFIDTSASTVVRAQVTNGTQGAFTDQTYTQFDMTNTGTPATSGPYLDFTTNEFIAPRTGRYFIQIDISFPTQVFTAGMKNIIIEKRINGASTFDHPIRGGIYTPAGNFAVNIAMPSSTVRLRKGDRLSFQINPQLGANKIIPIAIAIDFIQ